MRHGSPLTYEPEEKIKNQEDEPKDWRRRERERPRIRLCVSRILREGHSTWQDESSLVCSAIVWIGSANTQEKLRHRDGSTKWRRDKAATIFSADFTSDQTGDVTQIIFDSDLSRFEFSRNRLLLDKLIHFYLFPNEIIKPLYKTVKYKRLHIYIKRKLQFVLSILSITYICIIYS